MCVKSESTNSFLQPMCGCVWSWVSHLCACNCACMYSVSQKIPPCDLRFSDIFFTNGWEF